MAIRAGKRPGDAIDQSPQEKKMRASINDAAADLLCPISQELPVDPVIAEDGHTAAELGSDLGAYILGQAFFKGLWGLPKDLVQARFWLKRIVDGECEHKNLRDPARARVDPWLRELDGR